MKNEELDIEEFQIYEEPKVSMKFADTKLLMIFITNMHFMGCV
jgi:hypothetical protein